MKARNVLLGVLLGAIALLPACSSNSPTAPPPSPTPVAYSISLTASPAEALVGQAIVLSARVTSGGQNVADGFAVTFTVSGCVPGAAGYPYFFLGNDVTGTCEQVRTTVNGVATATLYSQVDGVFEVVARVPGQQAKVNLRWSQPINPNTLAIYQVLPNRGRPEGGEQVRILGRAFATPVTVDFLVGASVGHAQVLGVNAAGSEISAVTPPLPANITSETIANVRVCAAAGTSAQVCDTLNNGFTYERPFAEPRIYSVEPARGSYTGGEQVTIFGANFFAVVRVFFGQEEAQVASVSADNARITVFTPRHPGAHLDEELAVDVRVVTRDSTIQEQQVTLADAYTYVPDTGVPLLYSVVPSRGSPRGGETVVLSGKNFTPPVTVEFIIGAPVNTTLPAVVQNVNPDGTQITMTTPQASPNPLADDALVDIRITNRVGSANSLAAVFNDVFTYNKEARELDIYAVIPNRGRATGGERVVIAGRGFVQPVLVEFIIQGQPRTAEVVSVNDSGATIQVLTPAVPQAVSTEVVADVRVTAALGTTVEQTATLTAAFTYERQFGEPRIYGVVPNRGSYDGGDVVTILGANFFPPLRVAFAAEVAVVRSSTENEIVVETPRHTGQFITEELVVSVTVDTRFDTLLQQTVTKADAYTYLPNTGVPQLYQVIPSRGSPRGGELVTLIGRNFHRPVTVEFTFNPTLPAEVVSVNDEATEMVVRTPQASPEPLPADTSVDITITNLVGTAASQSATFEGVFTYETEAKDIAIYSIAPNRGKATGGDTVTIFGAGFVNPVQVEFIVGGAALAAQVTHVSETQITAITPAVPGQTTDEVTADVKVTAAFGQPTQKEATLSGGFTFERAFVSPQIYLISPNAIVENSPPYPVTIFGAGFFEPVRVQLGSEDARVQSVSPDGSTIEIVTPLHSGGPGTVDVTVFTRFETQQQQQVTRANGFTWLPATVPAGTPIIYSVSPNRGSRLGGESATILGENLCTLRVTATGFECANPPIVEFAIGAPLSVTRSAQVASYTPDGREVHILTPQASPEPLLQEVFATVRVTNDTASGELVNGFIYLRDDAPLAIYSVQPSRGRPEGNETVTIFGRGFVGPIVNVDFLVQGTPRAAQVLSFTESQIVVKTPATGVDASVEHVADVRVTVAVGTANERQATLTSAFTYEKRFAAPLIYSVVPNRASWAGGDTLSIIGANFQPPLRVTLGGEDAEVLASSTPSVLRVVTPLHPDTHLTQELVVDVTVYTSFETAQQQQAVLAGGFTWIPDTGVPLLYGVSPNRGNPRGGETIILTGKNFTAPVTVEFLLGPPYNTTLPASVVDVNGSGTVIAIATPQASPTPVTQEVVCAIRITNLVGSAFSQTATFQGVFTYESESNLAIYSVLPNRGSASGLEPAQIFGRGFIEPVTVDFIVAGQVRHAEVVSVTDTVIDLLTPPSGLDATVERIADVQVTAAAGTANQISDTLPAAFTYEKFFAAPSIYAVIPDRGAWSGNEVVTIVGANFFTPLRVFFGDEEATVDAGASTTSTLVVRTPQHLQSHLTQDLTVDVRVVTRFDTAQQQQVTLANGFTWKPDTGVPLLYSVVPNRGNPRGGETVTLNGKNFTQPVTVEFIIGPPVNATYPATVSSVDAAGGVMTIVTPQASPSPLTQEAEVDIRITNLVGSASSQTATYLKAFTYTSESDLAIYTVSPNRGSPGGGQDVEIRGRGFTQPVNVHFIVAGAERQAQVIAVLDGGTRIQIKTPASNVDASVEHVADVRVTVAAGTAGQKTTTLPAAYTYEKQFPAPAIYYVQPNRGAHAGGETVTIFGAYFFEPLRVTLGDEAAEITSFTQSQIVIKTPVHNPSHLTEDLTVDVTVFTKFETAQQQQVVLPGGFTWIPDTGVPILYSVVPSKGSPRGGETVILTGKNFTSPVNVEFLIGAPLNTTLPATVLDVNAAGTQITIRTPQASPTPVVTDVLVDIRITNLVGSANSKNATFNDVFVYEGESRPPVVYFVMPDKGSPRGGETVTIFGRFFLKPVRVRFSFTANGAAKQVDAEVIDVSIDGTQISILTPPASLQPLEQDAPVDITITTEYGTGRERTATLEDGFLYLAEHPTPELFALTPNSGPIEGGTRITITGTGFQYPVQVVFTIPVYGAVQAQVVSVNFNQLVVISPSITPMEPDTPTIAQVKAINMETGKVSNELPFRYGNAMFISAVAPTEGPDVGGTQVTIFGQGFVAPVAVELAGVPAQILTVAGTEIVVKSNAPTERVCEPISGPVEVTNIDSNLSATGPNFTYLPAQPLITSVEVFSPVTTPPGSNIVQEWDPTRQPPCNTNDAYGTYTVIVRGQNFETYPNSATSAMTVIFENPDVEVLTTFVSSTEIRFTLPDLSAVVLDKAACTTGGQPGLRDIPTGIPFTIKNNNNGCTDSLNPAIIINPCDPTCKVGAVALAIQPPSQTLSVGTTATFTVSISAVQSSPTFIPLAISGPSGLIEINGAGPGDDNVTIPAGSPSATFTVLGVNGGGPVTVTGCLPLALGGGCASTTITVAGLGVNLTPPTLNLAIGGNGNFTATLTSPAPSNFNATISCTGSCGVITISESSGIPNDNILAFLTGEISKTFTVTGVSAGGPANVTVTLDVSVGGAADTSTVFVGQYLVTLSPPTLTIPVGGNGTFTVTIDAPAFDFDPGPINGIPVSITQTGPGGVVTITADPDGPGGSGPVTGTTGQVVIVTGTQTATFTVNGVAGGGPVTITVLLPAGVGGATASSTVNVTTYTVTMAPETVLIPVGGVANFTVTLNAPALAPGVNIYINQTGQAGIITFGGLTGGVPPNEFITIPTGLITAAFTVTGNAEGGPITVTATLDPALGSSTDTSTVTVGTLTLAAAPASLTVPVHGSNTFILTLSKAQTSPTVVTLTSSNNAVAHPWDGITPVTIMPSVTIPANSLSSPPVKVYGVNLGPATIYAALPSALGGATAQVAIAVTQAIQFVPQSLTVPVGSQGTFTLQVASAQSTPTPISLDYSGTSGAITGPATVTLPAGANTVTFNVWGMKPTATAVNIVATLPPSLPAGLAGATATGTVTVSGNPYTLTFNPSVINLPVAASTNMSASFNYPLPPAGFGITYPLTISLAMSAPGSTVIWINGTAASGDDTFTWTNPGQQVADSTVNVSAQTNGGPVTITGVGPSALGSPTGTATATVGPSSVTLTMSPSPFMWVFGAPAPSITISISPVQGTPSVIQLQSSNPSVVQVPSSVTIPAGSPSASFTPTIVATGAATITATLPSPPAPAGVTAAAALATAVTSDSVTVFTIDLSPAAQSIIAGHTGTITFTLSDPLPAALPGVTLTGFNAAVISVPSPVTIPAGVTTFSVTVGTVAPGGPTSITGTMPASVGGSVLATTPSVTVTAVPLTLSVGSSTVYVGSSTIATVTTGSPMLTDTVVTLADYGGTGDLTIPATVTIPAGSDTATFTVTGASLGTRTLSAALPASLNPTNATVGMTIADLPLALSAPSATVTRGSTLTVTATIPVTRNADTLITTGESGVGDIDRPATVTIPAGSTSVSFPVTAGVSNGAVTLQGSLPAGLNASATPHATLALTVADATLTLTPDPLTIPPSFTATMTATLGAAPDANAVIGLVSTAPGIFTVPASVTIPAGSTTAAFTVTSLATNGTGLVQGTLPAALALAAGPHDTATINVSGLTVTLSPPVVASLMAGGGQLFTVAIDAAVTQDLPVTLSSADPGLVSVPGSVVIPAGSTSATFMAIAESISDTGPAGAIITATLPASVGGDTDTATITGVVPLTIAAAPTNVSIPAATEEEIIVTAGTTLRKNVTITIASANPVLVGIFDSSSNPTGSLQLLSGGNTGTFRVRGLGVGTGVGVRLDTPTALGGTGVAEADVTVSVLALQLRFVDATPALLSSISVAHGASTAVNAVQVQLTDGGGTPIVPVVPVTVNINSADPNTVKLWSTGGAAPGSGAIQVVIQSPDSDEPLRVFGNSPGGPIAVTGQLLPSVGGSTATLQVGVTNPSAAWTFSLAPTSGPLAGGTTVTITSGGGGAASAFWSNAQVTFGGVSATVVSQTPTVLVVTTPAHAAGAVDVTVTNPSVPESVTSVGAFTYLPPAPVVSSVAPPQGSELGGTAVTINGTFQSGATYTVSFDPTGTPAACTGPVATATTITCTTGLHSPGLVGVRVTDAFAQSSTLPNAFTYYPVPTIATVTPDAGPTAGGTFITIDASAPGDYLVGGTYTVTVGGVPATGVTVVDSDTITCTTPAHAAGAVPVTVTDAAGQSATLAGGFTYYAAPTVASISPTFDDIAGGAAFTLTGTNYLLGGTYTVTFGGTPAAGVTVANSTTITGTAPAHAAGQVNVTVTDDAGQSATLAGGFTYYAAPTIASVAPNAGPTAGSTGATITGTNYVVGGTYTVTFGGTSATGITVVNSTTITCTTPAHAAGQVNVVVSDPVNAPATLVNGFTYYPPPAVTGVSPASGSAAGGTALTVFGTFAPGGTYTVLVDPSGVPAACTFGAAAAGSLTCTTTGHNAGGPFPIQVTDAIGQTATSAGNIYTYTAALTLSVTGSAVTGGTLDDGTNSCTDAAGGGGTVCGPFTVSSSPLTMTLTSAATAWTWGGACAGCAANTSPCSLAVTTSPLTCSVTITAP